MIIDTRKVDRFVAELIAASRIPGLAIAVVHGDRTVFAKGYGVRDLGTGAPMTADTLYPIASTTKPLNALLLGTLMDEGRLDWDDPVRKFVPEFALADPAASESATLRDLVCMRTGLPRHDWLWLASDGDRRSLGERLQYLEPTAPFGRSFQYNNLTSTLAGHVAERVADDSWETLIEARILRPLGMVRTGFGPPDDPNVTRGYHETAGRHLIFSSSQFCKMAAPAGTWIHSTVVDMSRWIAFNLAFGCSSMPEIATVGRVKELRVGHMAIGSEITGLGDDANYGLGWILDRHRGNHRVSHGGYLSDVQSQVHLYPEANIGIVSVTNFGPPSLAGLINEHVLAIVENRYEGLNIAPHLALYEQQIEERRDTNAGQAQVPGSRPSGPLAEYAGSYSHRVYGEIIICEANGSLEFRKGSLRVRLRHWHNDSWVGDDPDQFSIHSQHPFETATPIMFERTAQGTIGTILVHFEPKTGPIGFIKGEARTGSDGL
jgi:CubicO group peptidase (beta-lactamase class C family)